MGMSYTTYQKLRSYCMLDLAQYILIPEYDTTFRLHAKLAGDAGLGRIIREKEIAHSIHQSIDLTPREVAASHLLAVISNHRMITWQREPHPPSGNKPAPPLNQAQTEALAHQTSDAISKYACFLPEREAAALMAEWEAAATSDTGKTSSDAEPKQSEPQNDDKPKQNIINRNQEWQNELESRAAELKKGGKKFLATKGKLASGLAKKTGEDVETIKRNTRKTW